MSVRVPAFRSTRAEDNGFAPRAGFEPFDLSGAEQSIVQRFLEVARARGDATAIAEGPRRVTYRELVARAAGVGTALRDRLGTRSGPVILRLPSGTAAVEVLLGVLCSGRSYLFLPPDTGADAVEEMYAAAAPAAVVVAGRVPAQDEPAMQHAASPMISLAELTQNRASGVPPHQYAEPGDLACLFTTSGTTGTPKIVGLSHRAVLFDVGRQVNDLYLGPDDRIDLLSHPSFSASLASIFTALLTGAELHILPLHDRLVTLGSWLRQSGITISTMTVSSLRALCSTLPPGGGPPGLRLISVGGETLLAKDVAAFHAAFPPPCVLQNAMASTETRTYAQYFVPRAPSPDGAVPIGWPVFAKDVAVLGPDQLPAATGQTGEIVIRSRYLARGYVNSPPLTADRFLPQSDGSVLFRTGDLGRFREDGCLVSHGRIDSLVKIRGYRVEPGAVEEALVRDPRVRQAAAVVSESSEGEACLVGYVVPEAGTHVTASELLEAVARRLPSYAVPSALGLLESLPVTTNGKTDYRALRERPVQVRRAASASSIEDTEAALLKIWSEVLGHSDFGVEDSFFDRGGDSLNAIRVQIQVHHRFGVDLPLEVFVRCPSVRTLAAWLIDRPRSTPDAARLALLHPGGSGVPLFCVPGIGGEVTGCQPLAERLGRDRPVYGLRTTTLGEPGGEDLTIESVAAAHLKAIDRVIDRKTPVMICGHSFGAIVAFEMAHQLRKAGRPLGLLAIIDMSIGVRRGPWWTHVRDILANVPAWIRYDACETDWGTLAARAKGKAGWIWRRAHAAVRRAPASTAPDFRAYFGKQAAPIEMQELLMVRLNALSRYQLRPLAATLVLCRARAQAVFGRNDRYLGWKELAEAVDVCDVPGHHESCAFEPHVEELAALLSARMPPAPSAVPLRVEAGLKTGLGPT